MKPLVLSGIGILLAAAVVLFAWPRSQSGATSFVYGRDVCHHCRMHIAKGGFGGELRDSKGTLTKYDDIGCLLLAMHGAHHEFPEVWVEDHAGGGFISLLSATLVRGDNLGTPMGYGVLAFKNPGSAESFVREHKAEIVPLEILLKDRQRFEPKSAETSHTHQEAHP